MNAYQTAQLLIDMINSGDDGTVDTENQDLPESGYFVGGVRPSLVMKDAAHADRGDIGWFVGGTDARYFGIWTDTEDGLIYVDAVDHMETLEDALTLGAERGEIAVWDITNGEERRVSPVEQD